MNRKLLEKLAEVLEKYDGPFDMANFDPRNDDCGCAAHIGAIYGVGEFPVVVEYNDDDEPDEMDGFDDYVEQFELTHEENDWLFDGYWYEIDNTAKGAAKRIRHLLKHGVPSDYRMQINGRNPYLFSGAPL